MTRPPSRLFPVRETSRRGRARRGLDATIADLRAGGDLEDRQAAMVALCRVLADLVDDAARDDDESRFTVARVAATYHAAVVSLLAGSGSRTDAVAALLAELVDDDGLPAGEQDDDGYRDEHHYDDLESGH